jgi:CRP-like cAMP-binding protein
VAANPDIRSDLHRIAQSIAARSESTTIREDDSAIAGPVGTFRDALLARYHEGYIEGLHDMAEAVVGYLSSRGSAAEGKLPEVSAPGRSSGLDRHAD